MTAAMNFQERHVSFNVGSSTGGKDYLNDLIIDTEELGGNDVDMTTDDAQSLYSEAPTAYSSGETGRPSREERTVTKARRLFVSVMFVAAIALGGVVFWATKEEENQDFQAQVSTRLPLVDAG